MREIPGKKRLEVLKLYFEGHSYDEIARRIGVSKGSVVNIINECRRGRYPELEHVTDQVDELRSLAVKIRKSGLTVSQAALGLRFYERIQRLIEPEALDKLIGLWLRVSHPDFPTDEFTNAAVRLLRLEELLGKPYEEALKDLESQLNEKSSKVNTLNSQIEALMIEKTRLESELRETRARLRSAEEKLGQLIKGLESSERLGAEKVAKLATFASELEKLGYDVERVASLANLVDRQALLKTQISKLQSRLATLNEEIKRLEEAKLALIREDARLDAASSIIAFRRTLIPCSSCRGPMSVPIPAAKELWSAMQRGQEYPARCQNCGYVNQVSPSNILISIGWNILTARGMLLEP